MLLELYGQAVAVTAAGLEGVRRALEFRPEVAHVDPGLPRLNGFDVARRLRAGLGGEVCLVALTACDGPEVTRRASEAGFDHYLGKPADPHELLRAIAARTA